MFNVLDRREVHAGILAHCRMGAGPGLYAQDSLLEQDALERALDMLGILRGHDIIGDNEDLDAEIEQPRCNGFTIAVFPDPTGPPIPMRVIFFDIRRYYPFSS